MPQIVRVDDYFKYNIDTYENLENVFENDNGCLNKCESIFDDNSDLFSGLENINGLCFQKQKELTLLNM